MMDKLRDVWHDLNRTVLDVYAQASTSTTIDFHQNVLALTKERLRFDSAAVIDFGEGSHSALSIQTLHLEGVGIEKWYDRKKVFGTERYQTKTSVSSPDTTFSQAIRFKGVPVAADILATSNEASLRTHVKRFGGAQSLVLVGSDVSTALEVLVLWRAGASDHYSQHDMHTAKFLLPHVLQARQINSRFAATHLPSGQKPRYTMLCGSEGRLYFVTPDTIKLMQSEWPQWSPPMLPAALLEQIKSNVDRRYLGRHIVVRAELQGSLICLRIAVRSNLHHLTKAEWQVAWLVAEGLSYKDVATHLGNSPATVRNHLHSVYGKLGVANKMGLRTVLIALEN